MNPYIRSPEKVIDPPTDWKGTFKRLGPGFILSASIVGSGELIATTIFGAEVGFLCLWVILFSCLVKVAVQLEFGRYTIASGKTSMQILDGLPGPKFGKAGWAVWSWFVIQMLKTLQVGGVVGGVGLALHALYPLPPIAWAVIAALAAMAIIFRGIYSPIEKWSIIMIALFTFFTVASLIAVQWTPFAIDLPELISGFNLTVPQGAILLAIGAFAITGVGGDEILAYNYWLIEKGYAGFTGPEPSESNADREAWLTRAQGWIKVMQIDALLSMACYTLMTALFYLLGAAVLHGQSLIPEGNSLIETLGRMYTDTLGPWARTAFLLGAFVVLFSTLLASLAAWSRLFSDAFGRFGWINFEDEADRKKSISFLSIAFPIIWTTLFFFVAKPGFMVIIGGSLTTLILFIVVYATLIMRYRWLAPELRPGKTFDTILWLSSIAITGAGVYSAVKFAL
ncbi:Nramp family divalent metal transporter [Akkermansiaceae bacterium]|nr:Nramp family divalent metal transporter [Akkermansiaceae bacterium]